MQYSDSQIEKLIRDMYDGVYSASKKLPEDLYLAIADYMKKALYEGFGATLSDLEMGGIDTELLQELRTNVYMFSAAKVYQQTGAFEELVAASKNFKEYYQEATKLYNLYNKDWAKTEYNTCIGQAQTANQWAKIQKDKETFPYLRYVAVMDENTSDICRPLDGTIRPVDDEFWDQYTPLNHFNCRCIVEKIDKYEDVSLTPETTIKSYEESVGSKMQDAFKMNPGKDGYIFSPEHPYFSVRSKDKKFAQNNFDLPIPEEKYKAVNIKFNDKNTKDFTKDEVDDFLKLSGIPTNIKGEVTITATKYLEGMGHVAIEFEGDGVKMGRRLKLKDKQIENEFFKIEKDSAWKGKGAEIFKSQVDYASKKGFVKIETYAGRDAAYNGYYTWARLGYTPLEHEKQYILKTIDDFNLKNNTKVRDLGELMGIKTGQEYWKDKGFSFAGEFDLKPGSYSQTTLNNYINGKGKK